VSDVYAVVDKAKKKNSTGAIEEQKKSTRPVRVHDYEEIDENLPPAVPPAVSPYHSDVLTSSSSSPVKKTVAQHSQSVATTVNSNR